MRTMSYVGQGWWSQGSTKFKKAEEAIKIYGKQNVNRIGPGVWLCTKNNEPVELLLMARDEAARSRPKTAIKAKVATVAKTATKAKGTAKKVIAKKR